MVRGNTYQDIAEKNKNKFMYSLYKKKKEKKIIMISL